MDREYRLHPDAEEDLLEAAKWYEDRRGGLGDEFIDAVLERIASIVEAPHRWRDVRGARRARLRRFPYAVVYREAEDGAVEVVAVAHSARRPGYWRRR